MKLMLGIAIAVAIVAVCGCAGTPAIRQMATPEQVLWHDAQAEAPLLLVSMPAPVRPEMARQAGIEGVVTVKVVVGPGGRVRSATVTDGPVPLHAAAIDVANRATFAPARRGGQPVEGSLNLPVCFRR